MLEEEQKQVQDSVPAVVDPVASSNNNPVVVTKQMFADILAAAGSEDSQGDKLDLAYAKWQKAKEAEQQQQREAAAKQREDEAQRKAQEGSSGMDIDSKIDLDALEGGLNGMLHIDGVDIPAELRQALEKRSAEIVAEARSKRQRNL